MILIFVIIGRGPGKVEYQGINLCPGVIEKSEEQYMQKCGSYLKAIREEKGYSIEGVTKKTKISPSVLRALEEGRLDNIDPVYLKGFLKMYCRFLGIDWEVFSKEHPILPPVKQAHKTPTSQAQGPHLEAKGPSGERPSKKSEFSFVLFIAKNSRIILTSLSAIAVLLLAVLIFKGCILVIKKFPLPNSSITPKSKNPPANLKKFTSTASRKEPQTVKAVSLAGKNTRDISAAASGPAGLKDSKPKVITLVIRAQENSFLRIKVDGRTVYQSVLHKGKVETWTAKDKIELSCNNAGGIVLEVDGKIFSSLGRRGQAIKNILINSEGLKIL